MATRGSSPSATAASSSTYSPVVITSFPHKPLTETFQQPEPTCDGIYSLNVNMIDGMKTCMPSGFSPLATDYFSPGIACPNGYYSACHDTTGVHSITTVTCCPARLGITLSCVDPATLAGVWETLFCTWIAPKSGTTISVTLSSNGVTSTTASSVASPAGVNAYGVRMVFQSSDLAITTTASNSASRSRTSTPTDSSISSSSSAPATNSPSSGGGGLSTGGIAAIAIVIPLFVLALAAGAFFWWRRRKAKAYSAVELDNPSPGGAGKGGYANSPGQYGYYGPGGGDRDLSKTPASTGGISELSGRPREVHELADNGPPLELPSDPPRR